MAAVDASDVTAAVADAGHRLVPANQLPTEIGGAAGGGDGGEEQATMR